MYLDGGLVPAAEFIQRHIVEPAERACSATAALGRAVLGRRGRLQIRAAGTPAGDRRGPTPVRAHRGIRPGPPEALPHRGPRARGRRLVRARWRRRRDLPKSRLSRRPRASPSRVWHLIRVGKFQLERRPIWAMRHGRRSPDERCTRDHAGDRRQRSRRRSGREQRDVAFRGPVALVSDSSLRTADVVDAARGRAARPVPQHGFLQSVQSLLYIITVALFIIAFMAQPFRIPSESMVPTLLVGDFLLVDKQVGPEPRFSPLAPANAIHRGDLIVFPLPRGPIAAPGEAGCRPAR